MSLQLEVRVYEKQDKHGDYYLIGGSNIPASVKLDEVTFLVFYPEKGSTIGTILIRPKTPAKGKARGEGEGHEGDGEEIDGGFSKLAPVKDFRRP